LLQLVTVYPEFEPFRKYGFWAPRAFFQMILRVKSNEARKQEAKATEGGQQEGDEPAVKPRKKRGKPRKAQPPVPEGHSALATKPIVAAQPVPQGQLTLEVEAVAAPSAPKAPQAQNKDDDDDGEEFDLDLPSGIMDTTMASTIIDLSNMCVDPNRTGSTHTDEAEGKVPH
jgi:hypothetical protein